MPTKIQFEALLRECHAIAGKSLEADRVMQHTNRMSRAKPTHFAENNWLSPNELAGLISRTFSYRVSGNTVRNALLEGGHPLKTTAYPLSGTQNNALMVSPPSKNETLSFIELLKKISARRGSEKKPPIRTPETAFELAKKHKWLVEMAVRSIPANLREEAAKEGMDALYRAFLIGESRTAKGLPSTWYLKVAIKNRIINFIRNEKKYIGKDRAVSAPDGDDAEAGNFEKLNSLFKNAYLAGQITDIRARIFMLRSYGLSHEAISHELRINRITARTGFHRVKKQLIGKLNGPSQSQPGL
ncbi:MAG: hypothetical protein AABX01_03675 [Candidatus Micrarchaeota archaeon]